MTLDEIKKLNKQDLEKHIIGWKKDLMKLRITAMIEKKADKPHMFKEIKRRIARAHTVRRVLVNGEGS